MSCKSCKCKATEEIKELSHVIKKELGLDVELKSVIKADSCSITEEVKPYVFKELTDDKVTVTIRLNKETYDKFNRSHSSAETVIQNLLEDYSY